MENIRIDKYVVQLGKKGKVNNKRVKMCISAVTRRYRIFRVVLSLLEKFESGLAELFTSCWARLRLFKSEIKHRSRKRPRKQCRSKVDVRFILPLPCNFLHVG